MASANDLVTEFAPKVKVTANAQEKIRRSKTVTCKGANKMESGLCGPNGPSASPTAAILSEENNDEPDHVSDKNSAARIAPEWICNLLIAVLDRVRKLSPSLRSINTNRNSLYLI